MCDVGLADFDYSRPAFILPRMSSVVAQLGLIQSDLVLFVMEILMRCSRVGDEASFVRNSYLIDPLHSVTDIALVSLLFAAQFQRVLYIYTVFRKKLHCAIKLVNRDQLV